MRLLELVEGELRARPAGGRKAPVDQERPRYRVEAGAGGDVLTEGKGEGVPPFKVPKVIYDEAVKALAHSKDAMRFEDILEEVSKTGVVRPGDFQIRVCLRFWSSSTPPLVTRSRSSYYPTDRKTFPAAAKSAWAGLAAESKG
jgi:hypothetical protein